MIKVFQKVLLSETDWEVLLHTFVVEGHAPLVIKKKIGKETHSLLWSNLDVVCRKSSKSSLRYNDWNYLTKKRPED